MDNGLIKDLIPNLISSAIDMLITIFVIDRLLAMREEKRWLPAKLLLYVNLLEIQDRLLFELVPASFRKPKVQAYKFGDLIGVTTYEIIEFAQHDLREELKKRAGAISKVVANTLDIIAARFDSLIISNVHVIEPDLLHLLLSLDRALDRLRSFQSYELDPSESGDLVNLFEDVIKQSIAVRKWVLTKSKMA